MVWNPLLQRAMRGDPDQGPTLFIDELLALAESSSPGRVVRYGSWGGARTVELDCQLESSGGAAELRLEFDRTWLPVRARWYDQSGRELALLEATEIDTSPGLEDADFAFELPAGARVSSGVLPRSFGSLGEARQELPFVPPLAAELPAGFVLGAVNVFGRGDDAALVLTYVRPDPAGRGFGGLISLTVSLAGPGYQPLPYGVPERHGDLELRRFELGEVRVIDWRSGGLALTLFGTVSSAELVAMARSVR